MDADSKYVRESLKRPFKQFLVLLIDKMPELVFDHVASHKEMSAVKTVQFLDAGNIELTH
jgi:hypothetical protein